MNNTGTKYVRIMKKNCILKKKRRKLYTMFKIFSIYIFVE